MTMLTTRIEEKYCVPERTAAHVLRLARVFLDPDRESPSEQCVTSLYLDSPELTFLGWQRRRQRERFKLRLRRYGPARSARVFAEIKHKSLNRVCKLRTSIAAGDVPALLSQGDVTPAPDEARNASLLAFVERQRAFAAGPQVLVRCRRQALRGDEADRALGLTVDRGLEFQPWATPSFDEHPGAWQLVPLPLNEAAAVIELKHGGQPPAWMARLMAELEPWHQSFSKYGTVMSCVMQDERGPS